MDSVSENDSGAPGVYRPGYFTTRVDDNPNRSAIWRHLGAYLTRWIPHDGAVLELGAGRCDFANEIAAAGAAQRIVAMDLDAIVTTSARSGVEAVVGDSSDLSAFPDATFDVVFASNLLEHLERPVTMRLLDEARRVLRPGGRLILLQPNFRLDPGRYFDDYTHVAIFTDQSLHDLLVADGWTIEHLAARFLPLTMKSRASRLTFLVPWYLRSPVKPLAGQMLVVANP